jgi:hypothetical protein
LGLVHVELLLGDLDGLGEIIVRQNRIDDLMAVLRQVLRFDAAWDRVPAVEEEDFQRLQLLSGQVVPVLDQRQVLHDFEFDKSQSGLKLFLAGELEACLLVFGVGILRGD